MRFCRDRVHGGWWRRAVRLDTVGSYCRRDVSLEQRRYRIRFLHRSSYCERLRHGHLAAPDGKNGLIFYLGQTRPNLGSNNYTIASFDITHLTPVGTLNIQNVSGTPIHFIRWGTQGLAFATDAAVYVIDNSFVTANAKSSGMPTEEVQRTWGSSRNRPSTAISGEAQR